MVVTRLYCGVSSSNKHHWGLTIELSGDLLGSEATTATAILWASVIVVLVCSTIAMHFDRQCVSSISDWTPTRLYYLMFLGYLGMVLAVIYVYHRHRIIGVPRVTHIDLGCNARMKTKYRTNGNPSPRDWSPLFILRIWRTRGFLSRLSGQPCIERE